MCLQDQRMAAGGTLFTRIDTVPAAGKVALPDLTQALWFGMFDSTGAPVQVFYKDTTTFANALPRDGHMAGPLQTFGHYSRDPCGSLFRGPLFYTADGVKSYYVQWFVMDPGTFGAIDNPVAEM